MKNVNLRVALIVILIMTLQLILPTISTVEVAIESGSDILLISEGVTITQNTTPEEIVMF